MGNGCFCKTGNYIRDINLDSSPQQPIINNKTEHIIKDEDDSEQKIGKLLNYFHESGKEILSDLKKKEKIKKQLYKKQSDKKFDTLVDNNQYVIMLERLLTQKQFTMSGPKRRETIRNGENIKNMVAEILKENKDEINQKKNEMKKKKHSLIIKGHKEIRGRLSAIIPKNGIITNSFNKK